MCLALGQVFESSIPPLCSPLYPHVHHCIYPMVQRGLCFLSPSLGCEHLMGRVEFYTEPGAQQALKLIFVT